MKKESDLDLDDDLRPEYDLRSLRVVRQGSGRQGAGEKQVYLEPDVAEVFPDSEAVNAALRTLIRIARKETVSR
jgi:hypothetical protein